MYNEQIKELVKRINDKKYMISLSLNKPNRHLIEEATQWMDGYYKIIPLKVRCLAIQNDYTAETFPRCPNCGKPAAFEKAYIKTFNEFCSDTCSKEFGRLSKDIKEKLNDKDWLWEKRITEQMSYENIAELLGCSVTPVYQYCDLHSIPHVKYNESNPFIMTKLKDKDWLYDQHVTQHKQLHVIAKEIGGTVTTVSRWMSKHGIK